MQFKSSNETCFRVDNFWYATKIWITSGFYLWALHLRLHTPVQWFIFGWQEIEKAWKMVDAAHDKETRAKDTIQSLKQEIANLSKLVEQGAGLTMGQEHRWVFAK